MTNAIYTLFVFLGIASLSWSEEHRSCDKILVNGSDAWEPIIWRNEDGQAEGILLEVTQEVFTILNIELEIARPLPWKRQLRRLTEGRLDMIMGAYFSEQRQKKYLYSDPLLTEEIRVFVHPEKWFDFKTLDDLRGRTGLRPLGGSYGTAFDQFARTNPKLQEHHDGQALTNLIVQQRFDYAVFSLWDGLINARKLAVSNKFIPLENNVAVNQVHFLFSRKWPCTDLLPEINTTLSKLKSNGTIKAIQKRYLEKFGL